MADRPQILDHTGRPFRAQRSAPVRRAGPDAAKTTDENRKHWAEADSLAPVSQLTPVVRQRLRDRSRYECQNNSYAAGLVRTLVNDTVGTGPRLQMLTPDASLNAAVEDGWRLWAAATMWALNARVLAGVRYVAGECFGVFRDSKKLDRMGYPVTLDVRLIEPDQVTHGYWRAPWATTGDDGIVCDSEGEVAAYKILQYHPGDSRPVLAILEPDTVPVENVIHWFQPERPGQLRGVTPLTPSLDIFAQLRRLTKATLSAAEIAAMLAGIMEQTVPLGSDADHTVESMDTIELVRGMLLTLPPGAKATQFKPEQPTTNYEMFVNAKLREIGRCLNVPFGKMAGDHSKYNYSSGRMDDAPYWHDREIERQDLEARVFDPVFWKWCDLARFSIPQLAAFQGQFWSLRHAWHYDARPISDPEKDASADELNLANAADTLAAIAARDGTTVERLLDQRAREKQLFEERGLPLPPWLAGTPAPARVTTDGPATRGVPANA